MGDFEDDIDKIFSEIAKNEKIENVEKIVNEEKIEHIKKYLNIIQSLNHTSIYINDIVIDLILDPEFSIEKDIADSIEDIYTFSEDLQDMIVNKYKDIDLDSYVDMMYDDIDTDDYETGDDYEE